MAYSKNDLFSPSVGFLSSFDVNTRQATANVWPIADVINLLMPLLIYGMAYRTGFCQVSQVSLVFKSNILAVYISILHVRFPFANFRETSRCGVETSSRNACSNKPSD